jgi:glycosyltransferase involved in cell wall biosynthesis
MKLFEYLASGRAVLSSDLPVFREVLTPEVALLLPPDEPERWEAALLQLKDNETLRLQLGRRSREKAGQFSWEVRAENMLAGLPGSQAHDLEKRQAG